MENPRTLVDYVIHQIEADIENGDYTALEELLSMVPEKYLKAFLSEYTGE